MSKIFISHSSLDREFAQQLYDDIIFSGHDPWLDKWEIKVGECIPTKIEEGIINADYIVIILSKNSTKSTWVDKEWKLKYWDEITDNKIYVLPILIEDCEIPKLLQTKKFADFKKSYAVGFAELMNSITPITRNIISDNSDNSDKLEVKPDLYTKEISELLSKLQSRRFLLSECIADTLILAQKFNNPSLLEFCKNELAGWTEKAAEVVKGDKPNYRMVEMLLSPLKLNMQYIGWNNDANSIFDYAQKNPDKFYPCKIFYQYSVSQLESLLPIDCQKSIMVIQMKNKDMFPNSKNPEGFLFGYMKSKTYMGILESIRIELTKKLLELLPEIKKNVF